MIVRVGDDFLRDADVFGQGIFGSVDHDRRESFIDTALAEFKRIAVIEVQADGQTRFFHRGEHEVLQISGVGVFSGAARYLQDQRRVLGDARVHDTLNGFEVVYVERADGVTVFVSLFEHFRRCYQWHIEIPPIFISEYSLQ